jgi:hypothetical protein
VNTRYCSSPKVEHCFRPNSASYSRSRDYCRGVKRSRREPILVLKLRHLQGADREHFFLTTRRHVLENNNPQVHRTRISNVTCVIDAAVEDTSSVLFCSVPFRSVPFRSVPFCSVLFCSVLFCSVLFCSVLFCSVLFCSVLHISDFHKSHLETNTARNNLGWLHSERFVWD